MGVKRLIKNSPLYPIIVPLRGCIDYILNKRHPIQLMKNNKNYPFVHLGTRYGGWTFVDEPYLKNCTIISAGLGEDASFDIEFASRYDANIIIIDPTPRAIDHFKQIISNIGTTKTKKYSDTGRQDISSYDLSNLKPSQLIFVEKALWKENCSIRFYSPINQQHVSHSIVNYQHGYSDETPFIEVPATSITNLMSELGVDPSTINLIKLDIEGAEIEVIYSMMADHFFPKQIFVEFDELTAPSRRAFKRISAIDSLLRENGYDRLHTNGQADFLYYRN